MKIKIDCTVFGERVDTKSFFGVLEAFKVYASSTIDQTDHLLFGENKRWEHLLVIFKDGSFRAFAIREYERKITAEGYTSVGKKYWLEEDWITIRKSKNLKDVTFHPDFAGDWEYHCGGCLGLRYDLTD